LDHTVKNVWDFPVPSLDVILAGDGKIVNLFYSENNLHPGIWKQFVIRNKDPETDPEKLWKKLHG
jgi:hypothetical protein